MKKGFLRSLTAAAVTTMLAFGLAGCATQPIPASSANSAAAENSLTPITVVLDYTPNTNHSGIYAAIDQGYYADAGLDVTVVQPPEDGADALVASGRAQFGISFQDWMANYIGSSEPLPVTAVAAIIQHNTSGILSRAGEGITAPSSLDSKRYGTMDVETEKAIVRTLVEEDGGSWESVEVVPANSTDEVTGLRTNQFDATWVFEGWAGQNAKVQDFATDYFAVGDIDERFDYYTPVIIANDAFLEDHPDTARAFLAATALGYEYAMEHPEEAAAILVAAAPEVDPELALASQLYLADKYQADAAQWGVFDTDRWNAFYAWMNEENLTELPLPMNVGFTNEYLPQ